ncbi:phosphoribosylglycinamide formyltransferase [Arundinibacter roseus]|uniref:Phosphoribosylglycinamide formyltransferase n=1 Tax=Arundinibacter roseus TaxID=2070510 RepID=A0A4R4KMX6_9BACT|nr:phosphoribosylglycinamide formyltransferase [Arundinibacter roseus]TDB67881.1 phosphoribosylglycinamide formyltransferase [Arundinibacter roseus]
MKRIAIFASGSGTNAEQISRYFSERSDVQVALILTNNPGAGVIQRARKLHIPTLIFDRKLFYETETIAEFLTNQHIDLIVLAGFMMLVPEYLINRFPDKILNIHPALLPKYGGKGMYGEFVHQAVVANAEKESGITIHLVNSRYDEGKVIFQASCTLDPTDDPAAVAGKIHRLEHEHYPKVVDAYLRELTD